MADLSPLARGLVERAAGDYLAAHGWKPDDAYYDQYKAVIQDMKWFRAIVTSVLRSLSTLEDNPPHHGPPEHWQYYTRKELGRLGSEIEGRPHA